MNRKLISIETLKRYNQLETIIASIDNYYYNSEKFYCIRDYTIETKDCTIEEISDNTYIYDMNSEQTIVVHSIIVISNKIAYVHMYSIINDDDALLYDDIIKVDLSL